ncbi:hypothetical protein GCM10009753_42850 [Streptantibioticus ferralitis]
MHLGDRRIPPYDISILPPLEQHTKRLQQFPASGFRDATHIDPGHGHRIREGDLRRRLDMPQTMTPRQVFERLPDGITKREPDQLPDLYAEDAVVEVLFAIPKPLRLVGRETLRTHFGGAVDRPWELRAQNVVIHETADPEVIVAEYDYKGRITTTGRSFRGANVIVLRVRDGKIVSSRDYHNHLVLAEALGNLPEVVSALSAE